MNRAEYKTLQKGVELYYVFNRLGYKYRRVTFLYHHYHSRTYDWCVIQKEGSGTICVECASLFSNEDKAREFVKKKNEEQIYQKVNEIGYRFQEIRNLGDKCLKEKLLRNITAGIEKKFYTIKGHEIK